MAELPALRAATALLLLGPNIPLLFMGQEWGSSSPFHYFADHAADMARDVAEGRRRELERLLGAEVMRKRPLPPDPADPVTFLACRLRWEERLLEPHAALLRMHRSLLRLRAGTAALRNDAPGSCRAVSLDANTIALRRDPVRGAPMIIVVRLAGAGRVSLDRETGALRAGFDRWGVRWTSEDPDWSGDPRPPRLLDSGGRLEVRFGRPSAIVLRAGHRRRKVHGVVSPRSSPARVRRSA